MRPRAIFAQRRRGEPKGVSEMAHPRSTNFTYSDRSLAGQARSLAQGVVLACDGDIVAVERLRQAL